MTVATLSQDERDLAKLVFVIRQLCEGRTNSTTREVLTANRTYNVATTGSDSNEGRTATSPFLTIQKAINTFKTIDLNGFTGAISVADGTYTGAISLDTAFVGGNVSIRGNLASPGNVIISVTSNHAVTVSNGAKLGILGTKVITNTAGYNCLFATDRGKIEFGGGGNSFQFGACGNAHMRAESGSQIQALGPYTVNGNGVYHMQAFNNASITNLQQNITLTGTPAMSQYWAHALDNGTIYLAGASFTGAGLGVRYLVESNAVIDTNNGGPNFLPGSIAGSTDGFGVYR